MTEQKAEQKTTNTLVDLNFIGWIQNLYDWLAGKSAAEGERRKKVYEIVSKAFFETRSLAENKEGQDKDIPKDAREKLSSSWQKAATEVRDDDAEMYAIFFEKAKYWQNPGTWSDEQIRATGIALAEIEPLVKSLALR